MSQKLDKDFLLKEAKKLTDNELYFLEPSSEKRIILTTVNLDMSARKISGYASYEKDSLLTKSSVSDRSLSLSHLPSKTFPFLVGINNKNQVIYLENPILAFTTTINNLSPVEYKISHFSRAVVGGADLLRFRKIDGIQVKSISFSLKFPGGISVTPIENFSEEITSKFKIENSEGVFNIISKSASSYKDFEPIINSLQFCHSLLNDFIRVLYPSYIEALDFQGNKIKMYLHVTDEKRDPHLFRKPKKEDLPVKRELFTAILKKLYEATSKEKAVLAGIINSLASEHLIIDFNVFLHVSSVEGARKLKLFKISNDIVPTYKYVYNRNWGEAYKALKSYTEWYKKRHKELDLSGSHNNDKNIAELEDEDSEKIIYKMKEIRNSVAHSIVSTTDIEELKKIYEYLTSIRGTLILSFLLNLEKYGVSKEQAASLYRYIYR